MLQLPHGCSCSNLTVTPSNWKTIRASTKRDWYISYRFYDPAYPKPKQKIVKGMNDFKDLAARQEATAIILDRELKTLLAGYNPITGETRSQVSVAGEIHPTTWITEALWMAYERVDISPDSRKSLKSVLNYTEAAIRKVNYKMLTIGEVRRKHMRVILDIIGEILPGWTNGKYNRYRSNLSILFTLLMEYDAVEFNPIQGIKKKQHLKKIPEVLTPEERKKVDAHLRKKKLTSFRLYMRIFFHSGARTNEMLGVKVKQVNLQQQWFIIVLRKGKQLKEVKKTIPTRALRYWKLLLKGASDPEHYVFSKGLVPGPQRITRPQITRRWEVHVKGDLGITCDFYSFKHARTTETMDAYNNAEAAAAQNSHTSTAMVVNIYDVRATARNHEQLKNVAVDF